MIELVTGKPGAGKTLITLARIKEEAEKSGRQVYYSGITDLRLPWIELDNPQDWWKVPAGSIVVVDECQRAFRVRAAGSKVPEHVEKLETHRHQGIDLVLITQDARLVDVNVRRLIGKHTHTVRAFGAKFATLHEFSECREEADKSRAGSIEHKWFYPVQAFDWYKSAEMHTHKRSIPARVWVLLVVPVVVAVAVWGFMRWQSSAVDRTANAVKEATGLDKKEPAGDQKAAPGRPEPMGVAEYLAQFRPRVEGMAYTAPIYDEVTKPVRAPTPVACVDWAGKGCRCYTQQGTRLDMDQGLCRQVAEKGFFQSWDEKPLVVHESARKVEKTVVAASAGAGEGVTRGGGAIADPGPPPRLSPTEKTSGAGSAPLGGFGAGGAGLGAGVPIVVPGFPAGT